jgi:hypothetical protein
MKSQRAIIARENGTIALLGIGLALISISTVLVLVAATSMSVFQRRLTTLSEMAALSGAKYGSPAQDFVASAGKNEFQGLRVAQDLVQDGLTREVRVCALWRAPFPLPIRLPNIEICGMGSARSG